MRRSSYACAFCQSRFEPGHGTGEARMRRESGYRERVSNRVDVAEWSQGAGAQAE